MLSRWVSTYGPPMPAPSPPRARWRDAGHLVPILLEGLLEPYRRWALEAKDDYVVWAGPTRHVVVVRPESARQVLGGNPAFARNVAPTKNLFGGGLLRLEGEPWRQRREVFAPPFRRDALDPLVPLVQEETERLIARWKAHDGPLKPTRDLSFLMLRVLGRLLFGIELDATRHGGRPLHVSLITLARDAVLRHLLPTPAVWAFHGREVTTARRFLDELCGEILERGAETPYLSALRAALADGAFSRETAIDELRTFLIAGHETTATALAWTLATLAEHPRLAGPLRDEAPLARRASTPEDVAAMEGSLRLVKEVMRLYPPVPISISRAVEDTELGSLPVPRGTPVDVCSYVLHRLPWLWPEPERVRPERFEVTPAPGTWIPFLIGPHTCLGARVALAELPLVAARLADAFDFTLPDGPPRVNLRLSLNPAGLRVLARPR